MCETFEPPSLFAKASRPRLTRGWRFQWHWHMANMLLGHFSTVVFMAVAAVSSAYAPLPSPSEKRARIKNDAIANAMNTTSVTIDVTAAGLRFDGHGALSAGGSSRLLIDYEEPYVVSTWFLIGSQVCTCCALLSVVDSGRWTLAPLSTQWHVHLLPLVLPVSLFNLNFKIE